METFKTLRGKRKRSQKWIAAKIGRHFSVVSQYENGRTKPSMETLEKIAQALCVSETRVLKAIKESHRLAHAPRVAVTNFESESSGAGRA
jgi:transcriptional regulator with XRE-family HTH domain